MTQATITISVDEEAARRLTGISPENRKKLEALLGGSILGLTSQPPRPLAEIMDEMGRAAQANGLTQEALADILEND